MAADDRYMLPSRANRDALMRRMNAMFLAAYGGLEESMFGVGPDARVQRLRESAGESGPRMTGLLAALEDSET